MADPKIEKVLATVRGGAVNIQQVERRKAFSTETVRITLEDGEVVSLFVKQLGQERIDHPDKQQRDREIWIYDRLLKGDPQLPVVKYFGNQWNIDTQRCDLFLEYVNGQKLKHCAKDIWFLTAQKLGALHGHFMKKRELLQSSDFLLRLDSKYFLRWVQHAIQALAEFPLRVQEDVRGIVARYDFVANLLASQPPTLVHNDLSPKNVIVDLTVNPARICFVDWEVAGSGCGLLDLVYLKYRLDPDLSAGMVSQYCSALASTWPSAPGGRDLEALLAACELHRVIYRIARREPWNISEEQVIESVAEAQGLLDSILCKSK